MSLINTIRQNIDLTPTERTVGEYILNNLSLVPRMSGAQLARETFTSQAAISRFCKKIGVASYSELKLQLAVELSVVEQNRQNIEQSNEISGEDTIAEVVNKLNTMSIETLRETQQLQSPALLAAILDRMKKAAVLDFYGSGASHFVALDANYKFMRVQKQSTAFALQDQQVVQAKNSGEDHLAFIFSYSGETGEMLRLAEILSQNKTPIVSVTKNSANSLTLLATHSLFVSDRETLYRSAAIYSRMSMLHIVDILYSIYINLDYEGTLATLAKNLIPKDKKPSEH